MAQPAWQRIPLIARSIISGLLVTFSGLLPWSILFGINVTVSPAIPWSIVVCGVYLFFWNRFVKGNELTITTRSRSERYRSITSNSVDTRVYIFGGLFSIGLLLLMMAAYRYFEIPIQELPIKNINPVVVAIYFGVASFVAGLCEEVGFRGYLQQPIEQKNGVVTAITISTLLFTVLHFNAAEAIRLTPFYVLGGINFGVMAWLGESLRPSILFHTITNFLSYLMLWLGASLFTNPSLDSIFATMAVVGILLVGFSAIQIYSVCKKGDFQMAKDNQAL